MEALRHTEEAGLMRGPVRPVSLLMVTDSDLVQARL